MFLIQTVSTKKKWKHMRKSYRKAMTVIECRSGDPVGEVVKRKPGEIIQLAMHRHAMYS
jgi:hypothetical protein